MYVCPILTVEPYLSGPFDGFFFGQLSDPQIVKKKPSEPKSYPLANQILVLILKTILIYYYVANCFERQNGGR